MDMPSCAFNIWIPPIFHKYIQYDCSFLTSSSNRPFESWKLDCVGIKCYQNLEITTYQYTNMYSQCICYNTRSNNHKCHGPRSNMTSLSVLYYTPGVRNQGAPQRFQKYLGIFHTVLVDCVYSWSQLSFSSDNAQKKIYLLAASWCLFRPPKSSSPGPTAQRQDPLNRFFLLRKKKTRKRTDYAITSSLSRNSLIVFVQTCTMLSMIFHPDQLQEFRDDTGFIG